MSEKTMITPCTMSLKATADVVKHRFAGFGGAYPTAGTKALGVFQADTDNGEMAPVDPLGILLIESGGAISAEAEVEAGTDGVAVTLSTGVSNGFALDEAAGAGEIIRIARGI